MKGFGAGAASLQGDRLPPEFWRRGGRMTQPGCGNATGSQLISDRSLFSSFPFQLVLSDLTFSL